jgi:phytoene synthase
MNQWITVLEAVLGRIGENAGRVSNARDVKAFQELAATYPNCGGLVLLPALKMIVEQFNIPREPLFHLLDGVERDIEPQPFETFDDSVDYCHQVATSVGFAALSIWGTNEPLFSDTVVKAAKACGVAFQWTNVLRDLLDDYNCGRIYLPQSEIKRYGLTPNQFGALVNRREWNAQKVMPKNLSTNQRAAFQYSIQELEAFEEHFQRLITYELERCEVYYENSLPLYKLIHRNSRRMFGMMWNRYYMLFRKMQRKPLMITTGKGIHLSPLQKLRLYVHWRFMPCFKLQ